MCCLGSSELRLIDSIFEVISVLPISSGAHPVREFPFDFEVVLKLLPNSIFDKLAVLPVFLLIIKKPRFPHKGLLPEIPKILKEQLWDLINQIL